MSDANDSVFISRELAEDCRDLANSRRRGSLRGRHQRRDPTASSYMPPLRGILLEDLPDGGTADCATTILLKDSTIQEVIILGGPVSAGTFKLSFKGKTTAPLAWNITAADLQTALEKLETIGPNNAVVTLGQGEYTSADDPDAGAQSEFPGLWIVSFVGVFAGRTDTPLMTVENSLAGGLSMLVVATTSWGDTGKVATVRAVVPVGTPTPMRAGAVVIAIAFPGIGYGVISCEPREFGVPYY
ncbi:MAG: hypothetical protein HY290_33530 [Planctomycetia bacterium]|nr:hypothetical protein [Planctomycetia bacterium]